LDVSEGLFHFQHWELQDQFFSCLASLS